MISNPLRNSECHPKPLTNIPYGVTTVSKLLTRDTSEKLIRFFQSQRGKIHSYLLESLLSKPPTPYQEFLLNHRQGQERICIYFDSFASALSDNIEIFFSDQKKIGYKRATEGYQLIDVYGYTVAFKDALWRAAREYNADRHNPADFLTIDDIFIFNNLLDIAHYLLSVSFVETRDEIIARHRNQLEAFHHFTAEIVSIFEEEQIWCNTTQGIFDVFGLSGTLFLFDSDNFSGKLNETTRMIGLQMATYELEIVLEDVCCSFKQVGLSPNNKLMNLSDLFSVNQFRLIASPIIDRKSRLIGILCVHDQGNIFNFSKFDQNLLFQFSSFTGAVSSNCRMVREIAEKQDDLRSLTNRLISIQEDERKRIAADIHDVLTQALTGMGYKALYCMDIIEKDTERLYRELELLTENLNETLRQSRQIISNLRPHVLDDIGAIAAFRKLIGEFGRKFEVDVDFTYSDKLQISQEKGIALFRILQEALHNIRRHSLATAVDLSLSEGNDNDLVMMIKDNGRGFDFKKAKPKHCNGGMGLLIMRERAENIKGTFRVESQPGNGTNIIVRVPL